MSCPLTETQGPNFPFLKFGCFFLPDITETLQHCVFFFSHSRHAYTRIFESYLNVTLSTLPLTLRIVPFPLKTSIYNLVITVQRVRRQTGNKLNTKLAFQGKRKKLSLFSATAKHSLGMYASRLFPNLTPNLLAT